jgi:hypothetical protein
MRLARTQTFFLATLLSGLLAGCGTGGTGLQTQSQGGIAGGLSTTTTGGGTTGGSASSFTGGASGTPIANNAFAATNVTGVVRSPMLSNGTLSGDSNACTRLTIGDFGGTLGVRPVVAQGNNNGPGQGFITLMSRTPNATPGTGNVRLLATNASPPALVSPFDVLFTATGLLISNNFGAGVTGQIVRATGIQNNGNCNLVNLGPGNLRAPIDMAVEGNFLYVAEYGALGGGGQVRRINLTDGTDSVFISGLNFPSSLAFDLSGGRRLLYLAENRAGATGANGGVARVDMTTFAAGPISTGGTPSAGVTFITPQEPVGTFPYSNPFDLDVDDVGNVVVTEGLTYDTSAGTFDSPISQGRIRVIKQGSNTSRVVLTGLTGTRGPDLVRADAAGNINTLFFAEGTSGNFGTIRQLTFRNTDAAIFNHVLLDSGLLNPLDTLFDSGAPNNLKYTVSFPGSTNGRVFDLRNQ